MRLWLQATRPRLLLLAVGIAGTFIVGLIVKAARAGDVAIAELRCRGGAAALNGDDHRGLVSGMGD